MKKTLLWKNRLTIVTTILFWFFVPAAMRAQTLARLNQPTASAKSADDARAIAMLKRLEDRVIVYRSMGEFEEGRRLARVPLQTFASELREITSEIQPIVSRMPPGKFKNNVANALASYGDGLFWWRRIDQPRVIHISALAASDPPRTPSDAAFLSTIPYTVAIHWRHAHDYLKQAERTLGR